MAKPLRKIAPKGVNKSEEGPGSTGSDPGVDYDSKAKGGQDFVSKHKTKKKDDVNGNKDAADKVGYSLKNKKNDKMGRSEKESEKTYEECNGGKGTTCPVHGADCKGDE